MLIPAVFLLYNTLFHINIICATKSQLIPVWVMKVCSEHFRVTSQTQYVWMQLCYVAKTLWTLKGLGNRWKLQSKQIIKSKLKLGAKVVNQLYALYLWRLVLQFCIRTHNENNFNGFNLIPQVQFIHITDFTIPLRMTSIFLLKKGVEQE